MKFLYFFIVINCNYMKMFGFFFGKYNYKNQDLHIEETGDPEFADMGDDTKVNIARDVVITNAKVIAMPESEIV